jgi:hypothetical protein
VLCGLCSCWTAPVPAIGVPVQRLSVHLRQLGVELPGCPLLLLLLLQACLVGRLLYVFGGEDVQRRPLADVSVLDLDTLTWQVRWRARGARDGCCGRGSVCGGVLLVGVCVRRWCCCLM